MYRCIYSSFADPGVRNPDLFMGGGVCNCCCFICALLIRAYVFGLCSIIGYLSRANNTFGEALIWLGQGSKLSNFKSISLLYFSPLVSVVA